MACKLDTKKGSINKPDTKRLSVDEYVVETSKAIEDALEEQKKSDKANDTKLKKERRRLAPLPEDGTYAIGRRLFAIDDRSHGPQEKERKRGIEVFGTDKDPLRLAYGSYWTKTDDDKSLIHLLKPAGVGFSIENYDFARVGNITLEDREKSGKLQTQQWVLLQAEDSFFYHSNLLTPTSGIAADKDFATSVVKSITKTNKTTQQKEKLPVYKSILWDAWIRGGKVNSTGRSIYKSDGPAGGFFAPGITTKTLEPIIQLATDFYDHSFELDVPFSHKEIKDITTINKPVVAKIDPTYNFLIEPYENRIDIIPEHLLPNLYVMFAETSKGVDREEFLDHLTIGGRIPYTEVSSRVPSRRREKDLTKINGQYFTKFARTFERLVESSPDGDAFTNFSKNFQTLAISAENLPLLTEADDARFLFPMYVDVEFSTDPTAALTQVIKDAKLNTIITKSVMKDIKTGTAFPRTAFFEATEVLSRRFTDLGAAEVERSYSFKKSQRRMWDLTKWINEFIENESEADPTPPLSLPQWWSAKSGGSAGSGGGEGGFNINEDLAVFLGQEDDETKVATDPTYRFFASLMKIIFVGKIRKLIKNKFRSFKDLIEGKLAYSETVLYRIEKHLADENGKPIGTALQNFYLPNVNESDMLRFVDTQVKYNTRYAYKIYAYQAVIGTKYRYESVSTLAAAAGVMVSQEPSVKLVEVPYFSYDGIVLDAPPLAPDVNVIPYRAVKDKMMFFLNANTGEYQLEPIIIDPSDAKLFAEIRKNKELDEDDPILFRSDDHTGVFQIFRSEEKPETWTDFSGKLIASVETDVSKVSAQKATAAAFVDDIEPNKKYYYTFRVVDFHGHISNPSPIYEIEMVAERNTTYPVVKTVEFAEELERKPARQAKRYIKIAPALAQTIVNEKKSGIDKVNSAKDVPGVFLGIRDESVWGTTFKIRLTSKQSGKKVDFNVTFNNQQVRISQEDEKQEQQ